MKYPDTCTCDDDDMMVGISCLQLSELARVGAGQDGRHHRPFCPLAHTGDSDSDHSSDYSTSYQFNCKPFVKEGVHLKPMRSHFVDLEVQKVSDYVSMDYLLFDETLTGSGAATEDGVLSSEAGAFGCEPPTTEYSNYIKENRRRVKKWLDGKKMHRIGECLPLLKRDDPDSDVEERSGPTWILEEEDTTFNASSSWNDEKLHYLFPNVKYTEIEETPRSSLSFEESGTSCGSSADLSARNRKNNQQTVTESHVTHNEAQFKRKENITTNYRKKVHNYYQHLSLDFSNTTTSQTSTLRSKFMEFFYKLF